MKNTATLGQIQKLLALLDEIPYEQVQVALGSPVLSMVLNGKFERRLLLERWKLVCLTANPEEIVVTKPHQVCDYSKNNPRKAGKYQIRVWKGSHGYFKGEGHVSDGGFSDGGPMLFEYYYEGPLQPFDVSYPTTGDGELCDDTNFFFPGYKWVRETKNVPDAGSFDVFTLRRK